MIKNTGNTSDNLDQTIRAQRAYNISIATGVIFILIAAGVMIINRSPRIDLSLSLVLGTSALAFFGAWLSRRGHSNTSVLLVIAGMLITIVGRVFQEKGLAIPTGIANIVLVSAIAVYALPIKWAGRAIGVSFVIVLITIGIDQYTVDVPRSSMPAAGSWISLALVLIYLFFLVRQFRQFNLRTKLIMGFLFVSTVPLLVLGWLTYTTTQSILEGQIKSDLRGAANSASGSIAAFMTEQTNRMEIEASLNDIVDYMLLPENEMNGTVLERHALNALQTFASKDNHILSYSLLNAEGVVLLDTVRANINAEFKDQSFFTEPMRTKNPFISSVLFPKSYSNPVIYVSIPILDHNGKIVGVLAATYDASILQEALQIAVENRSSGTEYTFLIDGLYFVNLAHSSNQDLLYKSYEDLDDIQIAVRQTQSILGEGEKKDLVVPQPEIIEALRGMDIQKSFQASSWENDGDIAESAAARVPGTTWIVVSAQPSSSIITLTQDQTRATITTSIAIIIASAFVALLASNFFTNPILELTRVAEKISAGDFTQKANIQLTDEIGVLGVTLNKMSTQVQELVGSLEKRVADRTAELEDSISQSEKRAHDLQTIADISRSISTEKDVEKLLTLITQQVSERFGFYHVGIFLLNESKRFALLRAANSPGGQKMLKRQHKLEVGQTGIVGNVTDTGKPRIALDTGADAVYFNNPDLPETHSEMALPLVVRGEIIGALDVQSTEPNAFTESDTFHLSLLADQVAIAIDNARLIEETQKALADSQSVFREYLAEAWQSKTASNIIGYYQTVAGGEFFAKDKLGKAETLGADKKTLAIPIRLRGQVIGSMNILLDKEREELKADQVNVVNAIAERLGLALENARLFEETSSRAARERLVTDITTKIRSTNNPQEMIQTAMEELKRALGASRIEVVPKKASSLQDK